MKEDTLHAKDDASDVLQFIIHFLELSRKVITVNYICKFLKLPEDYNSDVGEMIFLMFHDKKKLVREKDKKNCKSKK